MAAEVTSIGQPASDHTERMKEWVRAWQAVGPKLEAIRHRELRELDSFHAIGLLLADWDYHVAPRCPKSTSGLVEQQRLFEKLRRP